MPPSLIRRTDDAHLLDDIMTSSLIERCVELGGIYQQPATTTGQGKVVVTESILAALISEWTPSDAAMIRGMYEIHRRHWLESPVRNNDIDLRVMKAAIQAMKEFDQQRTDGGGS